MAYQFPSTWCLGLIFSEDLDTLVLVYGHKGKRKYAGMFNGIGGQVLQREDPLQAMWRTSRAETGHAYFQAPSPNEWRLFAQLQFKEGYLYCFCCIVETHVAESLSGYVGAEGTLVRVPVNRLPVQTVPRLKYLIPMALDKDEPMAFMREGNVPAGKKLLRLGFNRESPGSKLVDLDDGREVLNVVPDDAGTWATIDVREDIALLDITLLQDPGDLFHGNGLTVDQAQVVAQVVADQVPEAPIRIVDTEGILKKMEGQT